MKFLDLNGLTHFFGKVKTWAGNNYLSLNGGSIRGNVVFYGDYSLIIQETDNYSQHYVKINYANGISIGTHFDEDDETVDYVSINQSYISAPQFKKTNGKSTQALIADGSVKGIGSANGIAGLDANGYVPLAQLGNLDTTVAEVVTALPTTNIKKHIYLIRDTSGVTQNQYEEYIYTGDTSATYDASKWEKLGDFRATVDLANYAKKSEIPTKVSQLSNDKGYLTSHQSLADYAKKSETVDISTIRVEEKVLDVTPQGQKLQQVIYFLNFNGTIKEVVIKDATSNMAGFMSIYDKNKLDGIAFGATADSAIPISVIDALN